MTPIRGISLDCASAATGAIRNARSARISGAPTFTARLPSRRVGRRDSRPSGGERQGTVSTVAPHGRRLFDPASVGSASTILRQPDLAGVPGDDGDGDKLLASVEETRQFGHGRAETEALHPIDTGGDALDDVYALVDAVEAEERRLYR